MNTDHLAAMNTRLCNELERHALAQPDADRELRAAWVSQIRREIVSEMEFLSMPSVPDIDEDEMLNELLT